MQTDEGGTTLLWAEGNVPVSRRFADPYFSVADGLAEARHVFLGGNDLPGAWSGRKSFAIAELGFGTGLNALAACDLWRRTHEPDAELRITSFERYPLGAAEMARALGSWPELAGLTSELLAVWTPAGGTFSLSEVTLEVVVGDARQRVKAWRGQANAWFLDGFAPSRNPEMWTPELMRAVFEKTRPGGSFATYTASGRARRALAAAGFNVAKRPGFGRKREMSVGYRPTGQ